MKKLIDGILKTSVIFAVSLITQACTDSSQSVQIDSSEPITTTGNGIDKIETASNPGDYQYVFSGNTQERIDFTNTRGNYVLQITLLSDTGQTETNTTDTTPAMPLISDSLALYVQGGTYKFGLRPFEGEPVDVFAGASEDTTDIRLVNTISGAKLFVDNVEHWSGSRLKALSFVNLGKGFKNRYWAGKIKAFEVCVISPEADLMTANCF